MHRLRYRIFSQLAMWSNGPPEGDAFFSSTPKASPSPQERLIVVVALHLETVAVLTLPGSTGLFSSSRSRPASHDSHNEVAEFSVDASTKCAKDATRCNKLKSAMILHRSYTICATALSNNYIILRWPSRDVTRKKHLKLNVLLILFGNNFR